MGVEVEWGREAVTDLMTEACLKPGLQVQQSHGYREIFLLYKEESSGNMMINGNDHLISVLGDICGTNERGTEASKARPAGWPCSAPAGLSGGTADPVLSHLSIFQEDLDFFYQSN